MKGITPKFLNSPYLVGEPVNWHLREDAPIELVKEFEKSMKTKRMQHEIPKNIEFNNKEDI